MTFTRSMTSRIDRLAQHLDQQTIVDRQVTYAVEAAGSRRVLVFLSFDFWFPTDGPGGAGARQNLRQQVKAIGKTEDEALVAALTEMAARLLQLSKGDT